MSAATHKSGQNRVARELPARERLLAAADELFYHEGVHTVGIDRVIAQADVAKATLYSAFGSKDALIGAYLARHRERTISRLTDAIAQQDDPRQRIFAVFDAQAAVFREPGFNGCAFVAASGEGPSGGIIESHTVEFRTWVRSLLTDLAGQAGAADPARLGRQLHILYDGAGLTVRMDRDPDVAAATRDAVLVLLDSAIP